jgi:hypothetical protein
MATIQEQHLGAFQDREKTLFTELAAGSTSEVIGGGAAVVLAILGLAGIEATYMLPIAALAIGATLLIEGGVMLTRFADLAAELPAQHRGMDFGGGVSAEFLGGCAGIVLGVLALVGVAPQVLISVAALVFGGALLLGSGTTARFRNFGFAMSDHPMAHEAAREATLAASGAQSLVGIAAMVLSILALTHIQPVMLTLVALLIVGASVVLSGTAVTGWFTSGTRRMS